MNRQYTIKRNVINLDLSPNKNLGIIKRETQFFLVINGWLQGSFDSEFKANEYIEHLKAKEVTLSGNVKTI